MKFTAIDFETANGSRASVCAVGLTKVVDGQVAASWHSFVRPDASVRAFSPRNVAVHGIRPAQVRSAPDWPQAFAAIRDFAGTDTLVAHNAPFEVSVLRQACELYGIALAEPPVVCTLRAARALLGLEKNTLPVVAAHLGVPAFDHHEPTADALAAARVLLAMSALFGRDVVARAGRLPVPVAKR